MKETNILMKKRVNGSHVVLIRNGNLFTVLVDDAVYYRSYNELFAVQRYNAI